LTHGHTSKLSPAANSWASILGEGLNVQVDHFNISNIELGFAGLDPLRGQSASTDLWILEFRLRYSCLLFGSLTLFVAVFDKIVEAFVVTDVELGSTALGFGFGGRLGLWSRLALRCSLLLRLCGLTLRECDSLCSTAPKSSRRTKHDEDQEFLTVCWPDMKKRKAGADFNDNR
jgi:hypothetical protein